MSIPVENSAHVASDPMQRSDFCCSIAMLLLQCNILSPQGLSVHLNLRHPGKTDSHDTETPDSTNNSVENNDNEPFVTSGEQYIDYSTTYDSADESVCVTTINNKTKHAKVSFHKVIKYSYRETTSSNASCSTQDDEEDLENFSLRKPSNINGYSKDDFKKALVDLQYHVENQEIEFKNSKENKARLKFLLMKTLTLGC
jgi:hypothetical protein